MELKMDEMGNEYYYDEKSNERVYSSMSGALGYIKNLVSGLTKEVPSIDPTIIPVSDQIKSIMDEYDFSYQTMIDRINSIRKCIFNKEESKNDFNNKLYLWLVSKDTVGEKDLEYAAPFGDLDNNDRWLEVVEFYSKLRYNLGFLRMSGVTFIDKSSNTYGDFEIYGNTAGMHLCKYMNKIELKGE